MPDCGSDDSRAGRPDLLDRVEVAVRSTQNTDEVVAYQDAVAAIEMAVASEKREAAEGAGAREDGNTLAPAMALELVAEIIEMGPTSFQMGADCLGSHPRMKSNLKSPASLVA